MYHELAVYLIAKCQKDLKGEGDDVLVYGAELLISSFVELLLVLGMGFLRNRLLETICFLVFFCPLRSVSGGYHAPGYRSCTVVFSISFLILLFAVQPISPVILMVLLAVSSIVVWRLSPVEDSNKPLGAQRRVELRKRSHRFLIVGIIADLLLLFLARGFLFLSYIGVAFAAVSMLLLLGDIKNKMERRNLNEDN